MAKVHFKFSAMAAGKTAALLTASHRYTEHGLPIELYTSALDDRYGTGVIKSRMGISSPAKVFTSTTVFNRSLLPESCAALFIDECHFLTEIQTTQLHKLAHLDSIPVICYGLRTDFLGNPFPGSARLLALADALEEIPAICSCGKKARMNARYDAQGKRVREGAQVLIGGNDRYQSLCPDCFYAT